MERTELQQEQRRQKLKKRKIKQNQKRKIIIEANKKIRLQRNKDRAGKMETYLNSNYLTSKWMDAVTTRPPGGGRPKKYRELRLGLGSNLDFGGISFFETKRQCVEVCKYWVCKKVETSRYGFMKRIPGKYAWEGTEIAKNGWEGFYNPDVEGCDLTDFVSFIEGYVGVNRSVYWFEFDLF